MKPIEAPNYYALFRSNLLPLIPEGRGAALDVGCATGRMLQHLRRVGYQTTVGVELVPSVAELARQCPEVTEVHCIDINTQALPLAPESFDLVIVSHVLEHLTDPWSTLEHIVSRLKPGGYLVGALPNLRHYQVTWNLVWNGRFDYADHGILDRTHLRFFTKSGIFALLEKAGLEIQCLMPDLAGRKARWISKLSLSSLDAHVAYAYNFRCRKPS